MSDLDDQIEEIENAPRPYSALRFVSGMIIVCGWMMILFGWIFTLWWFTALNSEYQNAEPPAFISSVPSYFSLIYMFANTLLGLIVIGAGQLYLVILDMRDDIHATMQYVRLGLEKSPNPNEG